MTYCVGIKVKDGLVGIADTRIVSGNQTLTARKVVLRQKDDHHALFLMTSGLRALRDKSITYFNETVEERGFEFRKLYEVVNAFGEQIRRVGSEDRKALKESNYDFNIHALIGGQLRDDSVHKLFMIFPEGNWVEVGEGNPFFIIGNNGHGKPILDRALRFDSTLHFALKVGFLSFNATQVSSNDVGYPVDIIVYRKDSFQMTMQRLELEQMIRYSNWWQEKIVQGIEEFPIDWAHGLIDQ